MDSLSRSFDKAHGNRLKTVFSEILVHMLYTIGKVIVIYLVEFRMVYS